MEVEMEGGWVCKNGLYLLYSSTGQIFSEFVFIIFQIKVKKIIFKIVYHNFSIFLIVNRCKFQHMNGIHERLFTFSSILQ